MAERSFPAVLFRFGWLFPAAPGRSVLFRAPPSTKSGFLCAFWLRDPHFPAFRAQNWHFCVRMGDFSEIFGRFDTKMGFLCSGRVENGIGKRKSDLPAIHQGQTAASSGTQHLHPARRQPYSAEIRRWRRQSVQMGRKICVCLSSNSMWQRWKMRTNIVRCSIGRIPMLRVSKSGPDAPDC